MKGWLSTAPGRLVLGAVGGAILITLAGQATFLMGATSCIICDPLVAAPTGGILGGIALWRLGTDEF